MTTVNLAKLPFLSELGTESRDYLLEHSHFAEHRRGHVFFSSGDPAVDLFILIEGKVKLTRRARRQPPPLPPIRGKVTAKELRRRASPPPVRETVLWLMGPGEMFGELSIVDTGVRSTSATASSDGSALRIEASAMNRLIETHHDAAHAMLLQMASRLRRSDDQTAGLLLSDLPGRLAHLLIGLAERFGSISPKGVVVQHDLTQSEMAQIVGASRESVNKALSEFESRGLIRVVPGTVEILQPQKLAARVG